MKLYTIRAYNDKNDVNPDRTYIITANSADEAQEILADTAYGTQHSEFEIAEGTPETTAPSPQFWGRTGGARLLKSG